MPKGYYKNKVETVKLIAGHSLVVGNLPAKVELGKLSEILKSESNLSVSSFGLFETATPNYATYYPDVTQEDLIPKDSDFVEPVYRLLSNTVVQHRYNPVEFPEDVLKRSMNLLVGQTINIDHETAVGNGIGVIKAVSWQESYSINGLNVPAGINGVFRIDGKSNPRIARGVMMDPPIIHSNSVTVGFTWEPSHKNLTESEFMQKLGTFDSNGKLVRKIATNIVFYTETSLVGMGADPFAQRVKDGKITNPILAKARKPVDKKSLSADEYEPEQVVVFDWKMLSNKGLEVLSNQIDGSELDNDTEININKMELLRFLELTFGLEKDSLTEENYEAEMQKISNSLKEVKSENETLKNQEIVINGVTSKENIEKELKEFASLKEKLKEGENTQVLLLMYETGKTYMDSLRAETERLYKLSLKGKTADDNIVNLINTSDLAALKSLNTQYDQLAEEIAPLHCTDCGSVNVTRATSSPDGDGGGNGPKKVKTASELINNATSVTAENIKIFGAKK